MFKLLQYTCMGEAIIKKKIISVNLFPMKQLVVFHTKQVVFDNCFLIKLFSKELLNDFKAYFGFI